MGSLAEWLRNQLRHGGVPAFEDVNVVLDANVGRGHVPETHELIEEALDDHRPNSPTPPTPKTPQGGF
jgi:hypothetical protein